MEERKRWCMMSISLSVCKQALPLVNFPAGRLKMDSFDPRRQKEKVVVVMGVTGTGKSRLSIDLATQFHAEIVNSDKMQVYEGLDIVTNKVTEEEQCGIPHHLLGVIDPEVDFTATDFRHRASLSVGSIVGRDRLPIIVGGSNSYIEALVDDEDCEFRSKYDCCFLWVDVPLPLLHPFVSNRVDRMVEAGLVNEARQMFEPDADYSRGIRRAIGVPEMDRYFRVEATANEETRASLLEAAINDIKANTCILACRQMPKIHRLRNLWRRNFHRLDATEVFLRRGEEADEAWEKLVAGPSHMIVKQFLYSEYPSRTISATTAVARTVVAAATH
ncbi:hypothetical protein HHK36_026666 [Tetracentron sinense]|uniref:adenylate dimethylallyltransferase (ADP/ATP-dependent) n=1 Tax=Tetracentron sinense TaxID=13715 RepID=A0A834YH98_TETSI|nr:hypothetical protein HHK36_026666 [Tetracentron sinense]